MGNTQSIMEVRIYINKNSSSSKISGRKGFSKESWNLRERSHEALVKHRHSKACQRSEVESWKSSGRTVNRNDVVSSWWAVDSEGIGAGQVREKKGEDRVCLQPCHSLPLSMMTVEAFVSLLPSIAFINFSFFSNLKSYKEGCSRKHNWL